MKTVNNSNIAPVNPWLVALGQVKPSTAQAKPSYKSREGMREAAFAEARKDFCRLTEQQRDRIFDYIAKHCKDKAMYAKTMHTKMLSAGVLKNKKGVNMSLSSFQKIFTIFRETGCVKNRRELIIKCIKQNLSIAKTAEITQSSEGYVREVRCTAGLAKETKTSAIKKLLQKGKTVRQIAKATGASEKYIYYLRKKYRDQTAGESINAA
ncbi:Homeodomain-like domain-containing protein [Nitrosomonas aestuarii]|uniref:Homeodomain-like domain-containing protein n=1 Tax=Nitrosomonas aestuarii TaxID=52441 RepID=A0A1I4C3M2_9PROT|nr:helix-turn-helix domain-containing protein [Nitrosomonas aestuarii]SFK75373.1 Homeodomain-like domain-containing protein [Nitrosomonas aestuarii]